MSRVLKLSPLELRQLATGLKDVAIIKALCRAELSKHVLLVAGVDRTARRDFNNDYERSSFASGIKLLGRLQAQDPAVVAEMLALPQVGAWALLSLRRMRDDRAYCEEHPDSAPLWVDLGYLNALAAAAALKVGQQFEILVPLRNGILVLPDFGVTDIGSAHQVLANSWTNVRIRSALSTSGDRLAADKPLVEILTVASPAQRLEACWSRTPRVNAEVNGLSVSVALDGDDPFLNVYGHPAMTRLGDKSDDSTVSSWSERFNQAWALLTEYHRDRATAIAAGLRTIVPLTTDVPGRRVGSTSRLAFGAVGIGFTSEPVDLAESMVHEFQHVILGAVSDLDLLTVAGPRELFYAPWRDDPRPPAALLQGVYAFFGVAAFWRSHRDRLGLHAPLRGHVEFARWREATGCVASALAHSDCLTRAGECLVTGILTALCHWHEDDVPPAALRLADEVLAAHHLSWRAGHLDIDVASAGQLEDNWEQGAKAPDNVVSQLQIRDSWPDVSTRIRGRLIELQYRDPGRFGRWQHDGILPGSADLTRLDAADASLILGNHVSATEGYYERIAAGSDAGAWSGLALIAWRRARWSSGADPSSQALHGAFPRPELARALHQILQARTGRWIDPAMLIEWTAQRQSWSEFAVDQRC